MTLVIDSNLVEAERLAAELRKLINVIRVEHLSSRPYVTRDLALIKVNVNSEIRAEVMHLCEVFRARVIDVAKESVIIELTGDEEKIEGLIELLRPIGIIEMVRTGLVSLGRSSHVLDHNGYRSSWAEQRNEIQAKSLEKEVC